MLIVLLVLCELFATFRLLMLVLGVSYCSVGGAVLLVMSRCLRSLSVLSFAYVSVLVVLFN